MSVRGYLYLNPIVCWGPSTHASITLAATALATYGQISDFEYLRCGSIAFDDSRDVNIAMELTAWADVPARHRLSVQVYDLTNTASLGSFSVINSNFASQFMSVNLTTFFVAAFPSADARIILRYYLDTGSGAGTTAGTLHVVSWRIRRTMVLQ